MPLNSYQTLIDQVESLKKDFEKFYLKGNKRSGARIRAGLQLVKAEIKNIRNEIQEIKKSFKKSERKPREKKTKEKE